MGKIKVVWICGFSNPTVRERLYLVNNPLINRIKKWFGKHPAVKYHDYGGWITTLIEQFKTRKDVELHVIAGQRGMKRLWQSFQIDGIYYHIFKQDLPLVHYEIRNKHWFGLNPNILFSRLFHKVLINKIKPDIVNLFGAEGYIKASATLDIKSIPIFVSLQTFYSNSQNHDFMHINKVRCDTEIKVHHHTKYFGTASTLYKNLLKQRNPEAITFRFVFPTKVPDRLKDVQKKYDFVFFANGLSNVKGTPDAIEALSLVKKHKHDVTLCIVGKASQPYLQELKARISALGLEENIIFAGYFDKQSDMHNHIQKAHFALLPAKLDVIASTIRESMFLGLPVVAYNTSGTPEINRDYRAVLLSDIGDIQGLAYHMISLLESPDLKNTLIENAQRFANEMFDIKAITDSLIESYKATIAHYHHNKPIPEHLLF